MNADDWVAASPGMGTCFHQSLHRWADLRQQGETFKVAIGIVAASAADPERHLHAWLQRGHVVIASSTGERVARSKFYSFVGIERATVVLVNPRSIMRARKGCIDGETVRMLLDESGIAWRKNERGGVIPK